MHSYHFLIASVVLACAATAGCVRTNTEMLDSSTVVISARGTAFDTPATVAKATLVQAATVAQEHGFQYFKVVSANDATRVSTMYTPSTTHSSGTVSGQVSEYGGLGQFDGSYSGTSFTTPGHIETFIKPGTDVAIKMFHDGEVDPRFPGVWSVASVLGSAGDAPPLTPAETARTDTAGQAPISDPATQQAPSNTQQFQRFQNWEKSQASR